MTIDKDKNPAIRCGWQCRQKVNELPQETLPIPVMPAQGPGPDFLKFNKDTFGAHTADMPPKLYLTADDDEFDRILLQHFREEGFDPIYLPVGRDEKAYKDQLRHLADDLELGENYAIVAYGQAATLCLDAHIKPQPHLAALIAYYPPTISHPKTSYPPHLEVLCHLTSDANSAPVFRSYTYPAVKSGFAEHDLDEYDKVSASLAWSRTLQCLRTAFKISVDLEKIWEEHIALEFATKDAAATMRTMVAQPYVNHIPTLTGGIGQKDLFLFYRDYFIPSNPPSLTMKLVSRTIGTDRVVDEMIISFKHTQIVPWMLPDVPPTDKQVHVALVSVVCIRGGKLYHEHIYWDQASVLVQVGLLDPKLVPEGFKSKGLKRLPVYGKETAEKVLGESSQPSNELISGWAAMPERPRQAAATATNGGSANGS